jgi:tRNA(Ile)-lysidine synthase
MLTNFIFYLKHSNILKEATHWDKPNTSALRTKQQDLQILYKFNQLLIERNILQPHHKILIAVSGGQDSVCLLNILKKLRSTWNWKLGIIHCDHKWYSDSKLQAIHVSHLAANMHIDFYQALTTKSVHKEQLARNWRYELIRNVAIYHHFSVIVTGHTASDRVETLLYNLIRGSGVSRLQSISWKRKLYSTSTIRLQSETNQNFLFSKHVKYCHNRKHILIYKNNVDIFLIRPLLNISRIELKQLVQNWNLSIWSDRSNQNLSICRNRIRHQLLPYLRRYFYPKIDYVLSNCTEVMYTETLYLDSLARYVLSKAISFVFVPLNDDICIQLDFALLRTMPLAIQRRILKYVLDIYTNTSVSFKHVEQVRMACVITTNNKKHNIDFSPQLVINRSICLPGKKYLQIINSRYILICNDKAFNKIKILS